MIRRALAALVGVSLALTLTAVVAQAEYVGAHRSASNSVTELPVGAVQAFGSTSDVLTWRWSR